MPGFLTNLSIVCQLFGGSVLFLFFGILIPGYAWLCAFLKVLPKAERWGLLKHGETARIRLTRADIFTFSTLSGILATSVFVTGFAKMGVNLARFGAGLAIAHAIACGAIIALCRARTTSVESRWNWQWRPALLLLIAVFPLQLYVAFFGSPIVWDVPALAEFQKAFWGDYPSTPFRGGWIYPALVMASGIFQSTNLPLLNSGVGAGWLCVVLLYIALHYIARDANRVLWIALATLLIACSRYCDFILTTKFSVQGVMLYLVFLGLLKVYLERGETAHASAASIALGIGFASGLVGTFYACWTVLFLLLLSPRRMLPVIGGFVSMLIVIAAAGSGPFFLLLLVPASILAATICTYAIASIVGVAGPSKPVNSIVIVALTLVPVALTLAFHMNLIYSDYWWYAHRLLDLYSKGYGFFLTPVALFLAYLIWKRRADASHTVLSAMLFTALVAPVAIIVAAVRVRLPPTVPGVIFHEAGRVTSLYFIPLTLALVGASVLAAIPVWNRFHPAIRVVTLAVISVGLLLKSPLFSDPGFGGWERVAFRPLLSVWADYRYRAERAVSIAAESGDAAGFAPYFYDFSASEVRMSREAGDFGGPSNRCLFILLRGNAPHDNGPAQGFFEWVVIYHLFPYARPVHAANEIANDASCDSKRSVIVHQLDYDLAEQLPRSLALRRTLPTYRIYSEVR